MSHIPHVKRATCLGKGERWSDLLGQAEILGTVSPHFGHCLRLLLLAPDDYHYYHDHCLRLPLLFPPDEGRVQAEAVAKQQVGQGKGIVASWQCLIWRLEGVGGCEASSQPAFQS